MSGINGLGSNNTYIPGSGAVNGPGADTPPVGGTGQVNALTPGGATTPAPISLGGNATGVSYVQPSPLDPSHLVLPTSINDSTNVDITSCLVLLAQTAIELRKDQREEWIKQSQNALATSNTVADLQKQAAQDKFIGEAVSNGVSIGVSIAQTCASIGESGEEDTSAKATSAEADVHFGTDEQIEAGNWPGKQSGTSKAAGAGDVEGAEDEESVQSQARSIVNEEGLTSKSIGGESLNEEDEGLGSENKTTKDIKSANSKEVQTEGGTDDTTDSTNATPGSDDSKKSADIAAQKKEKAQFIANANAGKAARIQAKFQIANGVLGAIGSAGKLAGAGATFQSDIESAEASQQKALEDFQNTAANSQQDFANELKDYTQAILSTIRDVESARHAASSAIANI